MQALIDQAVRSSVPTFEPRDHGAETSDLAYKTKYND